MVVGAQGLAGEGLIVLGELAGGEPGEGGAPEALGPLVCTRAQERPPDQSHHHGPHGAAPVAARVEAGLVRVGGGERTPQARVTEKASEWGIYIVSACRSAFRALAIRAAKPATVRARIGLPAKIS